MKTCSIDNCDRKYRSKGYCNMHYRRWMQYGTPTPSHMFKTEEERFWEKVAKGEPSDCWLWTAATRGAYGFFNVPPTTIGAHRYSYQLANGPIPDGLVVDHICRIPLCVNPSHLQAVPVYLNSQNTEGASSRSRTGIPNVWWCSTWKRWTGQVTLRGRKESIGYFRSIEQAEAAAKAKRNEMYANNLSDREARP